MHIVENIWFQVFSLRKSKQTNEVVLNSAFDVKEIKLIDHIYSWYYGKQAWTILNLVISPKDKIDYPLKENLNRLPYYSVMIFSDVKIISLDTNFFIEPIQ